MTETIDVPSSQDELIDELRAWLESNWDPDLTVGSGGSGSARPAGRRPRLPANAYGRGLSRNDAVRVQQEIADFGALGAPAGLGLLLAAPTIATHGTPEQIELYVRDIVTGAKAWCQLFSEPGAGSDLAGLTTRAVQDGDEWIVNGQKVWTSGGQVADLGMLIARTDPDVPKHQGITWFAIDMHQPGVEVRPAARDDRPRAVQRGVPQRRPRPRCRDRRRPQQRLGRRQHHADARALRARRGRRLGRRGARHARARWPVSSTVAAGDFAPTRRQAATARRWAAAGCSVRAASCSIDLAKGNGKAQDPVIRQDLVRLHTLNEIGRFNTLRLKAAKAAGQDIPGMPNLSKLPMSEMVRLSARRRPADRRRGRHAARLRQHEQQAILDEATGNPFLAMVTGMALFAQAPPIYGGTDQVQRNIIGERVLGLPKEPSNDRTVPFSELPKNT